MSAMKLLNSNLYTFITPSMQKIIKNCFEYEYKKSNFIAQIHGNYKRKNVTLFYIACLYKKRKNCAIEL